MKKRILFICLGNICRSPAAEEIMRVMIDDAGLSSCIEVDSAGTYGGHAGELPDGRMRAAAFRRGYRLTSLSRQLTPRDYDDFDLLVVMDDSNYERVHRRAMSPEAAAKIHRMTDFCTRIEADHVPDPYYEGAEGFERVLDILEDACGGLLKEIRRVH